MTPQLQKATREAKACRSALRDADAAIGRAGLRATHAQLRHHRNLSRTVHDLDAAAFRLFREEFLT